MSVRVGAPDSDAIEYVCTRVLVHIQFCVCVALRLSRLRVSACCVHICRPSLASVSCFRTSLYVSLCPGHYEDAYAFVCASAPVVCLVDFSLYVCLRVTFVFLFAPKFLNCFVSPRGFVFVALCSVYFSAPLCVCIREHGYVDVEFSSHTLRPLVFTQCGKS